MKKFSPNFVKRLFAFSAAIITISFMISNASAKAISAKEAETIAQEAYIYLYPLITMDVTRQQLTNIEPGKMPGRGPMNAFSHMKAFPAADFREVVRPNFDTLYSSAWIDLTKEPVILTVPNTQERYYLMPLLDMWSNVFAVPGKRTTGTEAGHFAIVPKGWEGTLPDGVSRIDALTPYAWLIGRTQTNGASDYEAVHKVQEGYKLTPLSRWPQEPEPVKANINPNVDMKTAPLIQVNSMSAEKYFTYGAELMKTNSPQVTDWSSLARFKRIGLVPGESFHFSKLDPAVKAALQDGATAALKLMKEKLPTLARISNGWQMNTDTMGVYGNYYLKRAIVAMVGLGANQPEDAIYPLNVSDSDGKPMSGANNYVMHFKKTELPPVDAFWSLTMYDAEGFQVANEINRFAIGDRDKLKYNSDGSLDIYIQSKNPGKEKESNWLPSPDAGNIGVTLRLYAPQSVAINGQWVPPAVKKVE